MGKIPIPEPIKKSARKQSFLLIQGALPIFKRTTILLLPNKPHQIKLTPCSSSKYPNFICQTNFSS